MASEPQTPDRPATTVRMINKAGRVMDVSPTQVGEKEKHGYKIMDDAEIAAPVLSGGTGEEMTEVKIEDFDGFTANDLKEFCEEAEIEYKSSWTKSQMVDALVAADFIPPVVEEE